MRVPQSYIQKCKVVAHSFQAIVVFIAFVLTIAVMTKDGEVGGPTKYFFALVRSRTLPGTTQVHTSAVRMWVDLLQDLEADLSAVLPLNTRNHLPRHGPHVVPRPTLRKRLCLPCRRCAIYNTLVRSLHCSRHVELKGHQGRCSREENRRR